MSGIRFFTIHRSWEDLAGMLLGVLIGFSPWLSGQQPDQIVIWNAFLIGVLVLGLAQLEFISLQRWAESGEIACGLWLMASPFLLGYAEAGMLRYWHFVLGAIVVLLAALELWQDWKPTSREPAKQSH